jgi:CubicO group peptidase (beta-lactamase class C family)
MKRIFVLILLTLTRCLYVYAQALGAFFSIKQVFALVIVMTAAIPPQIVFGQIKNSRAARIRNVETGLLTHHLVRGEKPRTYTIEERLRFYNATGVSIAVINNGKIEWARGYGVREAGTGFPVTTDTLFQAASISKSVSAAAALTLVEDGLLKLDEDVNLRLRSWKLPENEFTKQEKVTLRRLLSHSAGTTASGFPGYAPGDQTPTIIQILNGESPANTEAVRVNAAPGSVFRYSGGGFTIAQLLMTEAAGRSFPEIMRERVLKPVGMRRSTFEQPLPAKYLNEAATGHWDGAPMKGKFNTYPEMAAAGLWTTASELARFGIEFQRALGGDKKRIVSPETARLMLTRQAENYGLGFWIEGEGENFWFTHSGSNRGYQSTFIMSAKKGQGAVVLTNGFPVGYGLATEIVRAIAREYGWDRFQAVERDAISLKPEELAKYVGAYAEEPGGSGRRALTVRLENGALVTTMPPRFRWGTRTLRASSATAFFFMEQGGELMFELDKEGKVIAALLPEPQGKSIRLVRQ